MADKKTIYLDSTEKILKEINPTSDGIAAKEFNLNNTAYGMSLDGSNNLVLDDAVTGSKTLAQLATGGGSGDANSVAEDYKDYLDASPYEFWNSTLFKIDQQTKTDTGNTTATFSNDLMNFTVGQVFQSTNLLLTDFLNELSDVEQADVLLTYDTTSTDAAPTGYISRDGGNVFQELTLERVDTSNTYKATHTFTDEATAFVLEEFSVSNADSTQALTDTGSYQKISQEFTATEYELVNEIEIYVNKLGSPTGLLYVDVVIDSSGSPDETENKYILRTVPIAIADLSSGNNTITLTTNGVIADATKYHVVCSTDDNYKGSYVASTTELRVRIDSSSPSISSLQQYNGTGWAADSGKAICHKLSGRTMDLRLKVVASATSSLKSTGVFYYRQPRATGKWKNIEVKSINSQDNVTGFSVSGFVVDRDLLEVFVAETGQVFKYPAFTILGNTVEFPDKTFYKLPNSTYTLIFDQNRGSVFDSSDSNASLMNDNHLGSTDSRIDRSQTGRGILLRNANGDLREIYLDADDNLVVASV